MYGLGLRRLRLKGFGVEGSRYQVLRLMLFFVNGLPLISKSNHNVHYICLLTCLPCLIKCCEVVRGAMCIMNMITIIAMIIIP